MTEKTTDKSSPISLLNNLQVASPCSESWEKMPGGEKVRSCARCQHRVYNLSEMTSAEAAELLRKSEGRLCVRFYRRHDGTIMTKDCPVGMKAVRQKVARAASVAFASVAVTCGASYVNKPRTEQPKLIQWVMNMVAPEVEETEDIPKARIPLTMAPPQQVELPATMGTPEPPPPMTHTMGAVALRPPVEELQKPYLKGLENEMQPDARPDPFVSYRLPLQKKNPHRRGNSK